MLIDSPPRLSRFDFGDGDSSGNSSFMQLLSTTNLDTAWPDFTASRAAALEQLPETIDPQQLIDIYTASTGNSTGSASINRPGATIKNFGASGAVETTDSSSNDKLTSLVEKYGPIILGLLAGNLVIGIVLCIIGLVTCLRSVVKSGATTRSIGPSYAPVRFKEAEAYGAGERETYHD